MSVYPSGLDTFTPVVSGVSQVRSVDINDLQAAIAATQSTIGVSGNYNFVPSVMELQATNIVTGIAGSVTAVVIHNGVAYVGGSFTSINGVARTGLAAIDLSNNSVITSFNANVLSQDGNGPSVASLSVADSNNLLVGGDFTISGSSVVITGLASVGLATGALNESFNANLTPAPYGNLSVDKILIDGSSIFIGGFYNGLFNNVDKLNKNTGALDGVFPSLTDRTIKTWAVDDGKLFIDNSSTHNTQWFLSTTDGSTVQTLNSYGIGDYYPKSGGAYFAGGTQFTVVGGANRNGVAKVSDKNSIQTSFVYEFYLKSPLAASIYFFSFYKNYIIFNSNGEYCIYICRASDCSIVAKIQAPAGFYVLQTGVEVAGDTLYLGGPFQQLGNNATYGFSKIDLSVLP